MQTGLQETNPDNARTIRDCWEKKLEVFKTFYAATLSLKNIIETGKVDQLDRIIQERQQCMDLIDRIDDYILKVRRDNLAYVSSLTDGTRAEIGKILRKISALDKECHGVAALRLDALQQDVLQAIRNRHEVQRYPDATPQVSRFLDMKL